MLRGPFPLLVGLCSTILVAVCHLGTFLFLYPLPSPTSVSKRPTLLPGLPMPSIALLLEAKWHRGEKLGKLN